MNEHLLRKAESKKERSTPSKLRNNTQRLPWTVLATFPAYLAVWMVRAEIAWFPLYTWIMCLVTTFAIWMAAKFLCAHPRMDDSEEGKASQAKLVIASAVFPWIIHFVYRWLQYSNAWNFQGEPYEILVLASLQNMTLSMAFTSSSARHRRLTITLSFFLMLFSVVISSKTWVYPLSMLYGVMAIWWLMGDYWERLQDRFVGQSRSSSLPIRAGVLIGTLVLLGCAGSLAVIAAPDSVGLTGWLPTSGGKNWSDPSARSGVGDGDMLVAAREQAFSFGPVESDLFIEDKQQSLYDMISEMDGLPPKKKKAEAAVGIEASLGKTNHDKLANSESSSREFSAIRQAPRVDRKKLADKNSPSLIYYSGPVPQRLAIQTFDNFDGTTWRDGSFNSATTEGDSTQPVDEIPSITPATRLATRSGKPWIQFRDPASSTYKITSSFNPQPH